MRKPTTIYSPCACVRMSLYFYLVSARVEEIRELAGLTYAIGVALCFLIEFRIRLIKLFISRHLVSSLSDPPFHEIGENLHDVM